MGMSGIYKLYEPIKDNLIKVFERALTEGCYIGGHYVEDFEQEMKTYLGCQDVIACKSGTYALIIALLAAGVQAGDEVITIATTYYATVYAICAVGAKPVFCDVLAENGTMDPKELEKVITIKTKAVIPVHLYGIPSKLNELRKICDAKNIKLVEDCSHCFGSKYNGVYIGAEGEFCCFSLYPTKNFGAFGDGGMITTNNKILATKMRKLRYFAQNDEHNIFDFRAVHGRCDSIQAALMIEVIHYLPQLMQRRKNVEKMYFDNLSPFIRKLYKQNDEIMPYVFPIYIKNRDDFFEYMSRRDIFLQKHFEVNLQELTEFRGDFLTELPNTEKHNASVASLPVLPIFENDRIMEIIGAVNQFAEEYPQCL